MARLVFDTAALPLLIEIEQLLFREAELLDDHRFEDWLELFSDRLHYWIPMRRNVAQKDRAQELTKPRSEVSWFQEDKEGLARRVRQIGTGLHWAEEPLSRTRHLISNVQLTAILPDLAAPREVAVTSCFLLYRNRNETETDLFAGKREDRLVASAEGWRIEERKVVLDQNVLLAKNLSFFF